MLIELDDPKGFWTNDDTVTGRIVLGDGVTVAADARIELLCEGTARLGSGKSSTTLFFSSSTAPNTSDEAEGIEPRFRLSFPSPSPDIPSTLSWPDQVGDEITFQAHGSIQWSIRVVDGAGNVLASRPVIFIPSRDQPNLFDLEEATHTNRVGQYNVTATLVYAADGIPQYPLSAGLGLDVSAAKVDRRDSSTTKDTGLELHQLRVVLCEVLSLTVENESETVAERWLLHECYPHVELTGGRQQSHNLDHYVADVSVQPLFTETFRMRHFHHHFFLSVDLMFAGIEDGRRCGHMSITMPVKLLSRVSGVSGSGVVPELDTELAYITDSEASEMEMETQDVHQRSGSSSSTIKRQLTTAPRVNFVEVN